MKFITDPYEAFRGLSDTPVKRAVWSAALILSATLLPFLLVPFEDFRYCDETYQAYCCTDYERAYLGMLSFFIGNIWMRLFGESLISLRVLMTICYIASVAIGCIYVRIKGFSILKTSLVYFLGVFGLVLSYLPLYGWDSGAYPFTALGILALLLYLDRPSRQRAAVLGIAAGMMVLSRVPLVIFLPICCVLIFLNRKYSFSISKKQGQWGIDCAIFLTTVLLSALSIICIMVGNPMNYISAIAPENTVAAHKISDIGWIFDRCIQHAYKTYVMLLPGCVALLLSCYYAKAKECSIWLHLFSFVIIYYVLRGAVMNQNDMAGLFWSNSGIILPTAFVSVYFGLFYNSLYNKSSKRGNKLLTGSSSAMAIIFTALALMQAFGSNSLIERIGWGMLMVFSFGAYSEKFEKAPRFTFYFLAFSALITFGFFVLKVRTLSHMYGQPINLRYATRYNGARPIGNDYYIVESVDSIKFISSSLETKKLRQIVVGHDINCFNFGVSEPGKNAGMLFDISTDDLYRDYHTQNAKGDADVVLSLNLYQDQQFESFLERENYAHYFSTYYPHISVWVKNGIHQTLPSNPFEYWEYKPRMTSVR